eukprot:1600754-Rhodomonas_salina.1
MEAHVVLLLGRELLEKHLEANQARAVLIHDPEPAKHTSQHVIAATVISSGHVTAHWSRHSRSPMFIAALLALFGTCVHRRAHPTKVVTIRYG